jgi:murein DD-endopeptidase
MMVYLLRLKALFKALITFINNLPRKHFFALILLSVFLLVVSFIPVQKSTKTINRPLTLPTTTTIPDNYSVAEPISVINDHLNKVFPDLSGNEEIEILVKAGDTLSKYFDIHGLSAASLQELLDADKEHLRLSNLIPGQQIKLLLDPENKLLALELIIDIANTLSFTLKDDQYIALLKSKEGQWRKSLFQGSVTGSFYVNAKQAGLSGGQIQQISGALQEKFDFNSQLRVGDTFHVLVSKQYIDGQYSNESEVLAVLIKTRNKNYTAFLNDDGRYYDQDGKGLSKAYRRYPLNGKFRLSSSFNRKRLHPITKKVSPHNGTDFAVSIGTKIYSIGDGVVLRTGSHPAAGKYIVIKHGRKYTARFLHLSKILVRKGQRIAMGDLIAKSGNTGRSTGPHLHYEFHVNNRPVNPMKVDLPLSTSVPKKQFANFKKRRDLFLKELGHEEI